MRSFLAFITTAWAAAFAPTPERQLLILTNHEWVALALPPMV